MAPSRDRSVPASGNMWRYLPLAVLATALVIVLPAVIVREIVPAGRTLSLALSVPLVIALSLGAASGGSALWIRRPESRSVVFADLMLWGWVRRLRAERRLAGASDVLGLGPEVSGDHRVEALTRLAAQLEARDAYTHGHSRRVARHAERIASEMRLSPADVAKVRTAAALHDVGKILTPREILNKPGRLTDEEFAVVRRHPGDGADMLAGIGDPEITAMVRHHHERLDGAGYPVGLTGAEIPIGARILAVADTFDAITSSRPYRRAARHKQALDVLSREAGRQLDGAAVAAFLKYYRGRRSIAWSALLTTGPYRLLTGLGGSTPSIGAGISQLPALGTAALLAVSPTALATPVKESSGGQRPLTAKRAIAAPAAAPRTEPPAPTRTFPSSVSDDPRPLLPRRHKAHATRSPPSNPRKRPARHAKSPKAKGAPGRSSGSPPAPGPRRTVKPKTPRRAPPRPAPPKPAPPRAAPPKPVSPQPAPPKPKPLKPAR